jgi:hypothetical protein
MKMPLVRKKKDMEMLNSSEKTGQVARNPLIYKASDIDLHKDRLSLHLGYLELVH